MQSDLTRLPWSLGPAPARHFWLRLRLGYSSDNRHVIRIGSSLHKLGQGDACDIHRLEAPAHIIGLLFASAAPHVDT